MPDKPALASLDQYSCIHVFMCLRDMIDADLPVLDRLKEIAADPDG